LKAARAFVADTKFKDFLASQQPLYKATNSRLREFVQTKADLLWFNHFFGSGMAGRFVIVPGMANGGPSYAAHFLAPGGKEEIYAIPGVAEVDAAALPSFNADWRNVLVHEVVHSYCGPVADRFAPRMEGAARQIYAPVGDAMRRQAYGSWKTLIEESLVRAVTVRYVTEHDNAAAVQKLLRQENAYSFFWVGDLSDLLGEYQKSGPRYPTLESFMPRVAQFFDDLAPRIGDLVARYQPRVISVSVPDSARDVDPGLKEVVVRFSLPMSADSRNRDPRFLAPRFDKTGTLLTLPVALEPNHEYQFPLVWPDGRSFVSADGVTLATTTLRFRTRAAALPAPQ
jgi:hypothetical protein